MQSMNIGNLSRKTYRTWLMDSRRWDAYKPRKNDVVVATYPKSGTTWVQRVVSLLIFQSLEVIQIDKIFPWWERRTGISISDVARDFEAQSQQRSIKTHLPLDGLPVYDEVKYIHVVRDGRDVALSYHNHCYSHTPESVAHLDQIGLKDNTLEQPYPKIPSNPADFFHKWLTEPAIDGQSSGSPFLSYFDFEHSYHQAAGLDNFLFLHYRDLQRDLIGEMQKVADFIGINVNSQTIQQLAKGASFSQMRTDGAALIPLTTSNFVNGANGFFNIGESGRWKNIFRQEDLAVFEQQMKSFPTDYAQWMLSGSRVSSQDA